MNLYFGLFCSAGVLFNSSELGFDFFAFAQINNAWQSLSQDILIIRQLDGREVKNHCRLRDHAHFFHFLVFHSKPGSCQPICGIIIANKSFSSAKAGLVCSFRASWKNRRHLGCSNVMHSRGCAVQNKGITLRHILHPLSNPDCYSSPGQFFTQLSLVKLFSLETSLYLDCNC